MINDKKTEYEDKYNFLYRLLWNSGLITKDYNYEDGSRVSITKDSFSGTLNFNYRSKEGYVLSGMATLMWDSENGLPIDITNLIGLDGTEYDVDANVSSVKDLKNDNKLNNIKTLRQLIDYFNNDYYIMLKEELNPLLEEAINDYL
jgi:hypothetical protein